MITAFAQITIDVDKSNYFDISFKIPSDQKQGMYDLTVWNGAVGAVCPPVKFNIDIFKFQNGKYLHTQFHAFSS